MKRIIIPFICIAAVLYVTLSYNKISTYIANKIGNNQKLILKDTNEYTKKEGFKYVNISEDYIPYSYNDLLDIIFTTINNGWDSFTFYCPTEYTNCISDMEKISNDDLTLTHINNFVHPFNSFTVLNTTIYESGEITIKVNHLYSEQQIKAINTEVDRIMNLIVDNDLPLNDNIKTIHDYIINTTKYDENEDDKYASSLAYGTLFDHYARCNGYTDTMAIFLTKLGVKNYKIATTQEDISYESTGHVWNAVYIDNKWLHLDLTWDDPVSNDGVDYLYHKYFLVTNEEMNTADSGEINIEEHNYRKDIYMEFN